jgi:hypothetical protein
MNTPDSTTINQQYPAAYNVFRATWHRRTSLAETDLIDAFRSAPNSKLFDAILELIDEHNVDLVNAALMASERHEPCDNFLGGQQALVDLRAELEARLAEAQKAN